MSEQINWLSPTFPQYRKIVDGEERLLDGTETAGTQIVKYDYTDEFKALVADIIKRKGAADE